MAGGLAAVVLVAGCGAATPRDRLLDRVDAVTQSANDGDADGLRDAALALQDTVGAQRDAGELTDAEAGRLLALAATLREQAPLVDAEEQARLRAQAEQRARAAEAAAQAAADERAAAEKAAAEKAAADKAAAEQAARDQAARDRAAAEQAAAEQAARDAAQQAGGGKQGDDGDDKGDKAGKGEGKADD